MKTLTREMLSKWLDTLAVERTLIAPKDVSGVLLYRPVQNSAEVVWDYVRPVMSVKDAFFPATERLLSIEKTGQTVKLQENLPEGEQVIFGVRSCDARGLLALDAGHEPFAVSHCHIYRLSIAQNTAPARSTVRK